MPCRRRCRAVARWDSRKDPPMFSRFPLRVALMGGAVAISAAATGSALLADEVNSYNNREPRLIQPLLDAYTEKTGVRVNTVFLKDGMPERVASEGQRSPADLLMTVDA